MSQVALKAPFPAFGGKSQVVDLVWDRLGDPRNYAEPFAFSAIMLLRRPGGAGPVETINDLNCVAPDTRILSADLRWRTIGEVKPGDKLLAFDENNGASERDGQLKAPSSYRKWRITTVVGSVRIQKPCYRLRFDDGTSVVASEDHCWLIGSHPRESAGDGGRGWRWGTTKGLICNRKTQRSWVLKLAPVQSQKTSYEAGWLGGAFDGEGSVAGIGGGQLNFTQRPGVVLEKAKALLSQSGFDHSIIGRKEVDCKTLKVLGGQREVLRFLMMTRPERLINNFLSVLTNRSIYGREHNAVGLVEKEFLGMREVVALETDCHTYIAEGLASHNCYVSNFWRAIQADPEAVANYADWPVNECDLHARHRWLVQSAAANAELQKVREDPEHYDAKIAGWWCWGACCWIGSGWCEHPEWEGRGTGLQNPRHVHAMGTQQKRPIISADGYGLGINGAMGENDEQLPHMAARGVHRKLTEQPDTHRPAITDEFTRGRGVNSNDALATCELRRRWLTEWFLRLQDRMRPVRVCCGHWARICDSDSTLTRLGTTGVFLDPPYRHQLADGTKNRSKHIYANDKNQDVNALCDEVQTWCLKWGGDRDIRIALCGLEGEYPDLDAAGWEKVPWKSRGGYGNRTEEGKANAARERIWFSPHCLKPGSGLFGGAA